MDDLIGVFPTGEFWKLEPGRAMPFSRGGFNTNNPTKARSNEVNSPGELANTVMESRKGDTRTIHAAMKDAPRQKTNRVCKAALRAMVA